MQQTTPEDPQSQLSSHDQDISSVAEPPRPHDVSSVPSEDQQPLFYTQEDDLDVPPGDDQDDQSSPFVLPFQSSLPLPALPQREAVGAQTQGATAAASTPPPVRRAFWHAFSVGRLLLIAGIVFATIFGAGFFVLAQSGTQPEVPAGKGQLPAVATMPASLKRVPPTPVHVVQKHVGSPPPIVTVLVTPSPRPLPSPTPNAPDAQGNQGTPSSSGNQSGQTNQSSSTPGTPGVGTSSPTLALPSTQRLNQLGWTQAGLSVSDAFDALRTGATFADREMSYDYRNIGTPTNHSGTLTGAVFLLTSGGQVRFAHYDKRVINNTLYNQIQNGKIMQQMVQAQVSLVQFQVVPIQGYTHQFAWVDVSFALFRSQVDPTSGQRTEGLEQSPRTSQPLIHHLFVLLIRVSPQNQGANAPMGGTGWLVNTYALDPTFLPTIATAPFL